jgi:hypothetical protein
MGIDILRTIRTARVLAAFTLMIATLPAQTLPPGLKDYLQNQVKFTPQEMASIAAGKGVAKALDTQGEELGVVGVALINVPPDFLFSGYSQFDKFEPAGALQFGRFSNPAKAGDAAKLTLDADDLKVLRNCKPGDCDVILPDRAIERFRTEIDWKASNAADKANALYREMMANYMADYQKRGDEALTTLHNRRDPKSVREGLDQLLANTPQLPQALPQLAAHLKAYPKASGGDSKDYFFWIKSDTGMKPTTTADHLVVHKETTADGRTLYVFAAKSLFANHYYRDAIALRFLIPATSGPNPTSAYYVNVTRAHADGLTGIKAKVIRGKLLSGMQESTSELMGATKKVTEDWYRANKPPAKK